MDDPAGCVEKIGVKLEALSNLMQLHKELGGVALIIDDMVEDLNGVVCELRTKGDEINNSAKFA